MQDEAAPSTNAAHAVIPAALVDLPPAEQNIATNMETMKMAFLAHKNFEWR
jgi:hypothetical protein